MSVASSAQERNVVCASLLHFYTFCALVLGHFVCLRLFSSFFALVFSLSFVLVLNLFWVFFVGISWQLGLSLIYSLAPAYLYPSRFAVRLQPSWVLWECVRSSELSCLLCWSCQDVLVQKSWRDIWRLGPHGSAGHL